MVFPEEQPVRSGAAAVAAARGETLDVLLEAFEWQLSEARWEAIEQLLDTIQAALESGDLGELIAAVTDLELSGPVRIIRIGTTPTEPPEKVRERLNRLVHALAGTVPRDPDPGDAGMVDVRDDLSRP